MANYKFKEKKHDIDTIKSDLKAEIGLTDEQITVAIDGMGEVIVNTTIDLDATQEKKLTDYCAALGGMKKK